MLWLISNLLDKTGTRKKRGFLAEQEASRMRAVQPEIAMEDRFASKGEKAAIMAPKEMLRVHRENLQRVFSARKAHA